MVRYQYDESMCKDPCLQALIATSPFPIALVDENNVIIDCTPRLATICDLDSPGLLRGLKIETLVKDSKQELFEQFISSAPLFPQSLDKQFPLHTASGGKPASTIYASRWSAADQRSGIILSFVTVMTETEDALNESQMRVRKVEQEKQTIQAQLRQSQKMEAVGRLAGGIAHDFNNLLMAITGYSDLLLKRIGDTPWRKDVEEIGNAGRRAASITRQLLAFSRRQSLQTRVLDLCHLVQEMQSLLCHLIGEDILLHTQLSHENTRIKADAAQIEQVLLNLAVNSRDAMPDGGTLTISVDNVLIDEKECVHIPDARPGEMVRLIFKDSGEGIEQSVLENIFEPFFSTKEDGKGTGLGLSVVYGIIKQHGGWIQVESSPHEGTSFSIFLPRFAVEASTQPAKTDDLQKLKGNGEWILVVEDEDSVRNFAHRALCEHGYHVLSANSTSQAEELFYTHRDKLDLVFTDVVLTDASGIDLVNRLREEDSRLKALVSSGYPDKKAQLEHIHRDGYYYLPKPYFLAELLKGVKVALDGD